MARANERLPGGIRYIHLSSEFCKGVKLRQNVEDKLNFNYLDRLVAGEETEFRSGLRFWRTRYILIPSGKDPMAVQGIVPKGEHFAPSEIRMTGASKVLEILSRNQWTPPGGEAKPLRLLPTTFDPSACVLDDGLMAELERLTTGKEIIEEGKALEGMTLQNVGEMMCQPNNGLIIRDRWWNCTSLCANKLTIVSVYEDTFTGEMFCEWLLNTFTDVKTREEAAEWGRSLFDKGLIGKRHLLNSANVRTRSELAWLPRL